MLYEKQVFYELFFIIFFNYGSNPQPLHLTRHLTRHPPIRHFDSGGLFFCFFWFSCIIIGIQKPASPLILISRIPLFIGFIGLFLIYIYVMHPPVAICASRIGHPAPHTYIVYICWIFPYFSYNWQKTLIFQRFLASKSVFSFSLCSYFPRFFLDFYCFVLFALFFLYCLRCFLYWFLLPHPVFVAYVFKI